MIYSSHSQIEVRKSLRRIVQTILGTQSFWPRTELASQLQQEIEQLLERIDSMEARVAYDYAYALSTLATHMPDEIGNVYGGDLAHLAASASGPRLVRT